MTTLRLRYSKDGGRNWSAWRHLDTGDTGDFLKPVIARRLGCGEQWVFDVLVTDPVRADLIAMEAQLETTDS